MRSLLVLACCVATAACATSGTGTGAGDAMTGRDRVIASNVPGEGGSRQITSTVAPAVETRIDAPPDVVLLHARAVYERMEIPVTVWDPTGRRVGNLDFWKSRRLDGQPMARLVNCGDGLTGPKADSYRIYMALVTSVLPDTGKASRLSTRLVASATDLAGGSPDRVTCGTTGILEARIAAAVRNRIGS